MTEKGTNDNGLSYFNRATIITTLLWTVTVIASAAWNVHNERVMTLALAKKEANANFNKDMAFRLWGTKHGGVYVPPTEQTPPNPYLSHIPDRDVTLPSGKRLTLMNPAYMLRQMMADFDELYGVKGRITSLKPLNPANGPDAWEREALTAFEQGSKEFFVLTGEGEQRSLRLMRPLVVKEGCLKCHGQQGYQEGDIRGGVGVAVPMTPYLTLEKKAITVILFSHLAIWLLGAAACGLIFYRGKSFFLLRAKSEAALRESEARFRRFFKLVPLPLCYINKEGVLVYANDRFDKAFGYTHNEVSTLAEWWQRACPEEEYRRYAQATWGAAVAKAVQEKTDIEPVEYKVACKDGEIRDVLVGGITLEDNLLVTFIDLTARKLVEQRNALMLTRFKALWEISRMRDADIKAVFEATQEKILDITNSEYAFYGVLNEDETIMTVTSWSKEVMAACGTQDQPIVYPLADSGLWGNAIRERRSVIINDYSANHPGKKGVPAGHLQLTRLLAVPVFTDKRITAVAAVANKPTNYTKEDARQIEGILSSVQLLVERRKAEEALQKLNEELEQRVAEQTSELVRKNSELEKLNKLFVGRELKMVELKAKIEALEKQSAGRLT